MTGVGVFFLGVPVWRAGFALAGLLAFLLSVPAGPQALLSYRESLGRRETVTFAALVVAAAGVAGMVTTMVVAALRLDLPYVYSPDQLLG